MSIRRPILSLLAVLALGACGDSGGQPTETATGKPARTVVSSVTPTPASSGPIGIVECDDYVRRMRECVAKAPEAERAKRKEAVDGIETTWMAQAKSATDKSLVKSTCSQSLSALEAGGCN